MAVWPESRVSVISTKSSSTLCADRGVRLRSEFAPDIRVSDFSSKGGQVVMAIEDAVMVADSGGSSAGGPMRNPLRTSGATISEIGNPHADAAEIGA
jgi:hypothetical protein